MRTAPLIAFLILGGAVAYVLWDTNRRRAGSAAPSVSPTVSNGYRLPDAASDAALSQAVVALASVVGKTAGGATGAAAGGAVSSGEQELGKGLGAPPLSEQQIYDLSHNAAQNGLVAGQTSGANVGSAVGGAAGAGPFDFIAGFLSGAASSDLLRKGGIADRLNLPKWDPAPRPTVVGGGGGSF